MQRSSCGLLAALPLVVLLNSPAAAQEQDGEPDGVRTARPILEAIPVGTRIAEPGADTEAVAAPDPPQLTCNLICSPFLPRQIIASVEWPDEMSGPLPEAAGVQRRLDISLASTRFTDVYGTVPLEAVPEVSDPSDVTISPQPLALERAAVAFQLVQDGQVLPRPDGIPDPDRLLTERVPGALAGLDADARAALDADQATGGITRLQAVAQTLKVQSGQERRAVVVEGLQPGITYRLRLVDGGPETGRSVDTGICRVPVCPADFAN